MEQKRLDKILDYLHVIKTVYASPNWGGRYERAIVPEVDGNFRKFCDILQKNIPLSEIPSPKSVFPDGRGWIGIEWEKVNENPYYMDLFYVYVTPSERIFFESDLGSLKTSIQKESELKEHLDEQLLIHIKHFA